MLRLTSILVLLTACSEYNMGTYAPDAAGLKSDTGPVDFDIEGFEEAEEEPEEDDCVESTTAFDIEEVSTLQDAFGLPHVRDGLTLSVTDEHTTGGRAWRPASVEVLVMYPQWYFEYYDDSNTLTAHFYPTGTPTGSAPYSRSIQIRKADLDWSPLTLPADADWSGGDREQMAAWLSFELASVVGEDWLTSRDYFVSLQWDDMGFPNVGYSNFELSCAQNWTDYSAGSYVQNSGSDCSWPMLKMEIETLQPGDCE